jgi:hypothetical protein
MIERRQAARFEADGELAILPTPLNVRVLDISMGGVMLGLSRSVDLGARGRLRINLGGSTFAADVQVQRVTAGTGDAFHVGAMFVNLDDASRQMIERFMLR